MEAANTEMQVESKRHLSNPGMLYQTAFLLHAFPKKWVWFGFEGLDWGQWTNSPLKREYKEPDSQTLLIPDASWNEQGSPTSTDMLLVGELSLHIFILKWLILIQNALVTIAAYM